MLRLCRRCVRTRDGARGKPRARERESATRAWFFGALVRVSFAHVQRPGAATTTGWLLNSEGWAIGYLGNRRENHSILLAAHHARGESSSQKTLRCILIPHPASPGRPTPREPFLTRVRCSSSTGEPDCPRTSTAINIRGPIGCERRREHYQLFARIWLMSTQNSPDNRLFPSSASRPHLRWILAGSETDKFPEGFQVRSPRIEIFLECFTGIGG